MTVTIGRRELLVALGGAAIAWPGARAAAGEHVLTELEQEPCRAWCADSGPRCADPLARAASIRGDEYARHVAATGALVRNQAFVFCGRCDAQQLVHRGVLATRARHTAIRPAGISHSSTNSWAMGTPARLA